MRQARAQATAARSGRAGRSPRRRLTAVLVAIGLLAAACNSGSESTPSSTTDGGGGGGGLVTPAGNPRLFGVRLSEGSRLTAAPSPLDVVAGDPIDLGRIDEILARLPDWTGGEGDQQSFNWPTESVPPPRTGETVDVPFPQQGPTNTPDVPTGPLHVLRHQPDGDVPVAPYLSITFDQPMVPVGTVGQVNASDVPVTITPQISGTWQWIGTRTLRFDYAPEAAGDPVVDRLPMATTYAVTVPDGTTSATGGVLADEVSFTFTTPPPGVQTLSPVHESLALDQLWVLVFDQRIDPAAVLPTIHVTAGGDDVPLRLASAAEVAADDSARNISEQAAEGRWMAVRPAAPMPADAAVRIVVGPGTPSAEGPATTTEPYSATGRTYPPLRVRDVGCDSGNPCRPGDGITVVFTNELAGSNDLSGVRVSPAPAGLRVTQQWGTVRITGVTAARTEYTVTLPAGLTDVFGQTLGEAVTRTITIGEAAPSIQQLDMVTTLDPFADSQQLGILTVNHDELRVRVFDADPEHFDEYVNYWYARDSVGAAVPDWTVLSDTTVRPSGDADVPVLNAIDLSDALDGKPGHVIVLVEPVPAISPNSPDYWTNRPSLTWAQSTSLGVDALSDATNATVWATDLRTGAPVDGVTVRLSTGLDTTTTDGDGLGRLTLPRSSNADQPILIATKGDDTAILPTWMTGYDVRDQLRWYVFDDRQVYRPGEEMRVKGWVRRLEVTGDGGLHAPSAASTVRWTLTDAYGVELANGTAPLGPLGGFDLAIDVPETANLGQASLNFELTSAGGVDNASMWHSVDIQEYRRPEFEVTARPESQGPYLSTSPATVAADANYYAGGPLADAPVDWYVTTTEGTYSPPGWDGFTFGVWQPWWYMDDFGGDAAYDAYPCCGPVGDTTSVEYHGTTDADGSHYLQIDFEDADGALPDLPVVVTAEATVTDVNRQAWADRTNLLVHAADRYVGLRTARAFVRQGDSLDVDVVVTGIDGRAVPGVTLTVTAGRVEWVYTGGEWAEQVLDEVDCPVTSAEEAVPCSFPTEIGGQYRVTAVVADAHGGHNRTELTTWVTGASARPSTRVEQETVTVVPNRTDYAPGDTAELLVQAPFTDGTGLLTVSHQGIRSSETFTVTGGTAVLQIPLTESDVPGLDVAVEVVGATPRTAADGSVLADVPPRPAYAVGGLSLPVSLVTRTLTVDVSPANPTVQPGDTTSLDVRVTDAAGRPVAGSELAVVVVDEAVLALSGYELADPLAAFYSPAMQYGDRAYSRSLLHLLDPDLLTGGSRDESTAATEAASETTAAGSEPDMAPGADTAGGGEAAADDGKSNSAGGAIDVRSQFDALALFEPSVTTGADGTVTVPFTMPDTLTRYRVMVVAVSGDERFGSGESAVTAQLPLSVRPSAPRFANYGDQFQFPVVVQNLTDNDLAVDVVLETSNLQPGQAVGQTVQVPAGDRVEVRFPVATAEAGTAGYRVAVVSGDLADAATGSLPVYTPATAAAFATYGVVDNGSVVQPLLAPEGVIPEYGGLEVTTSSTALQALTDAVLYIQRYRYDSTDAMASRIMAIASLRDVLEAFAADGLPSAADMDATVEADVQRLVALQMYDGGWGWWDVFHQSLPYQTVQVTHALLLAKANGYTVPQAALDSALQYLADIRSHIPAEYGQQEKDTIRAYAVWVLDLAGRRDTAAAQALLDERGDALQADALAWIWGSLTNASSRAEVARVIGNRAVETAGAANITTAYDDGAYVILHSDRRTDGIVLDALIAQQPDSDLIPKLVAGLLAHRVQGAWDDIQENSFILLALHHYFTEFEAQTPDFVARVWLGDRYAGSHTFQGRETDRANIDLPMADVIANGDGNLVLEKDGTGRLYYRIGLRYAPDDLSLDPLDRGFVVTRTYEAVDDPGDVWQDADGTWHVKAGARVRVSIQMVADSQRTHVALVDPLPAGLEALNPDLANTQAVPPTEDGGGIGGVVPYDWVWYWGPWYEHQQLRDDRTEAFTTFLPAGTYSYTYVARATTPGTFVVPPTRAEEMYEPETFGRAATDTLVVEA